MNQFLISKVSKFEQWFPMTIYRTSVFLTIYWKKIMATKSYSSVILLTKDQWNKFIHWHLCILSKETVFPALRFNQFEGITEVSDGYISRIMLYKIYKKSIHIGANLKKAPKLTYTTTHPGSNKQNVSLALRPILDAVLKQRVLRIFQFGFARLYFRQLC